MLNDLVLYDQKSLAIRSEPIEVCLSEEVGNPLSLILPPFDDLKKIAQLARTSFSVKALADSALPQIEEAFAQELSRLEKKRVLYKNSKTYLIHLANLAEFSGHRERELEFLRDVAKLGRDNFVSHRIAEHLLAEGRTEDAKVIFESFDLSNDVVANLRLAQYHIQRNELDLSLSAVARALVVDPLNYGARLMKGGLALVDGNVEEAISNLRIAAEERPTSSVLFTNLGVAYAMARNSEKSLSTLRRAVALDPLNRNAVTLLADIAHQQHRDEDALPALRYYVSLEQTAGTIWGRLARALLQLKLFDEATDALRRQATLEDNSSVWNNIGVAHVSKGNRQRAYEAFKHAISRTTSETWREAHLAARNILVMLIEDEEFDSAIRLARYLIAEDAEGKIQADQVLSDVYALLVDALFRSNNPGDAVQIATQTLLDSRIVLNLRVRILIALLAHYALAASTTALATSLARDSIKLLQTTDVERDLILRLANNIAFAFAESGDVDSAQGIMQSISAEIHKAPYPTATLGLIAMRKGQMERGAELYEEAVRLATRAEDKRRIRQKLNLEIGTALIQSEPNRARRHLRRAAQEKEGSRELSERASQLLNSIAQRTL